MFGINESIAATVLVTAVVFWLFGGFAGFRRGVKTQSEVVIDILIAEGYLKTRTKSNGELEIQKLNEDS